MDASAPRKSLKTTCPEDNEQNLGEGSFGRDPLTFIDCREAAAGSSAIPATVSAKQAANPSLRSQLVSHFGNSREQKSKAPNTPTADAEPVHDELEDDEIALPTPIHTTLPVKITTADGREVYVYEPIPGLEHLFKRPHGCKEAPGFDRSSNAYLPPNQQREPQTPGKPAVTSLYRPLPSLTAQSQHQSDHVESRQRQGVKPLRKFKSPVRKAAPRPAKRNTLKRTRSVAQGLAQPCQPQQTDEDSNEYNEETTVQTESSRTFHVGDIEALKSFLRYRIDELTMKPVRGMVTAWLKRVEPKRKGGYGPYHKMLPSEAPADATPPWWPRHVPYVEPAHLDKDGLLSLAVDIIMQHRNIAIDEVKRAQGSWTTKLEQVANYEIDLTPPEQYSSSRNFEFSKQMKDRAVEEILPSLFEVSRTYEDYVLQHSLWTYEDLSTAPRGQEITWQFVPRPPKQVCNRKRLRATKTQVTSRPEPVIQRPLEESGDETEIDEEMVKMSNQIIRRAQIQAARNEAKAAAAQAAGRDQVSPEPVIKVSSPRAVREDSSPVETQHEFNSTSCKTTPAPTPTLTHAPTPSSSFGGMMTHLHVQEDVKGGCPTSFDQAQQAHHGLQSLNEPMRYHHHQIDYNNANFQNIQDFSHSGPPPFGQFVPHGYIGAAQYPMYNHSFPMQMGHPSFNSNLPPPTLEFPYEADNMFSAIDLSMPLVPSQVNTSFNGLPMDFESGPQSSQHLYGKQ